MNRLARLTLVLPVLLAAPVCFMAQPADAHGDSATLAHLAAKAHAVAVVRVVGDMPAPFQHRAVQLQTLAVLKGGLPGAIVLAAPAAPGLSGTLATAQAGSRLVVFLNTTSDGFAVAHRSSAALPLAQTEVVSHVQRLIAAMQQDATGDALRSVLAGSLASPHPRVGRDAATALGGDRGLSRLNATGRRQIQAALQSALEHGDPRLPGLLLAAGRLQLDEAPDLVAAAYVAGHAPVTGGLQQRFLSRYTPTRVAQAVSRALPRPAPAGRALTAQVGPTLDGAAPGQILRATRLLKTAAAASEAQHLLAAIAQRDTDRGLHRAGDAAVTLASRSLAQRGLTASPIHSGRVLALQGPAPAATHNPPMEAPVFRCIRPRRD